MRTRVLTLAALLLGSAAPAAAQLPGGAAGWGAGTGLGFEHYRFVEPEAAGMRSLSLLFVPLAVRVPLPRGAALEVGGGYARGTMERLDGSTVHLAGPVDTELRVAVPVVGRGVLSVAGIVVLPTAEAAHTREEAEVAGAVATDLLPFRVSRWGTGGGAGASATVAHAAGGFGLGASVGYVVAREFEPLADEPFAYRPGDQLRLRVAVDRTVGSAGKASLLLGFQRYGDDQHDGASLYQAGNRYRAVGSYAFRVGAASSGIAYAGVMRREEGTYLADPLAPSPTQDFLLLGGGLRLPLERGTLVPTVDLRVLRTDGVSAGSWLGGAGISAELPLGAALTAVPSVRARLGNVAVGDAAESGIAGADLGLALRYGGGAR